MLLPTDSIDILIFVAFLLLNIVVGFRYRGKSRSFEEFAIGDKNFSTATLTATLVATWMSGSLLFISIERTYSSGLYFILAIVIGRIGWLILTGLVVGPRMGKFLNNVSVPASLGKLYGNHVQAIAGISTVLSSIGYIAVQFKVIARILSMLLQHSDTYTIAGIPLNEDSITIIAASIIILYATSGGVKAVTFTDVIQFLTFGTLLPVLALVIWHNLSDTSQVVQVLTHNPNFSFQKVIRWSPEFQSTMILICYFIMPSLSPELFQRMAMARDVTQVQRSISYATLLSLGVDLCIMWIAVLLLADQPGLNPQKLVQYMINTYTYPGLKGLLSIGVIALAMSTADSALNACAVVIANDIIPPLKIQQGHSLKTAKWATVLLGFLAVLLTLRVQNLLNILLGSANFYAPIVVVPMLLAVFGFETSRRVVLMAIATGAIVVVICLFMLKSVNSFFPGMLANLLMLLGAHYALGEKGGWGHNPLSAGSITTPRKKSWVKKIRNFNLYTYLEGVLPTAEYFYSLFGFYVFTATYASFYILPHEIITQFAGLYKIMQYSVMLLFTTFLAFPIWPRFMRNKRVLIWLWPLSVFYALFVMGGILVVLSGFATAQMLIFTLNFVMAVLLLHWPLAAGMVLGGPLLVVLTFRQNTDLANSLGSLGTLQFRLIYGLLLLSSFLIALFKHKQAYDLLARHNKQLQSERKVTQQELVKALGNEARFFSEITAAGNRVLEAVTKRVDLFVQYAQTLTTPSQLPTVRRSLEDAHQSLKDTMAYLQNVVYRIQGHLRLQVDIVDMDSLLERAMDVLKAQHTQQQLRPRVRNITDIQHIQCDVGRIQQLLVNAWLHTQQHNTPQKPVFMSIQKTTLGYPIPSIKNYIKEVPALCMTISVDDVLSAPKKLYMGAVGNTTLHVPQEMKDLPLLDNQRIIDAHYGVVEFLQENSSPLTQVYVIPVQLRDVRPSMMDLPQMEIDNIAPEYRIILPEETSLLKRLKEETYVSMELAEQAIMYIKKYHGPTQRKTGEPFYLHPIAATNILLNYADDQSAVLATLLHDTVEDTPLTLSEIGVVFGPDVATIVNKVTHLDGQFRRILMDKQENVRQLLDEVDIRVLQVKLADRLHNMRTLRGHAPSKQKKIAEETLDFFVPIANHLGLRQIEEELQELITTVIKKA